MTLEELFVVANPVPIQEEPRIENILENYEEVIVHDEDL